MALLYFSFLIALMPLSLTTAVNPNKPSRIDVLSFSCTNMTVHDEAAYAQSYRINVEKVGELMKEDKFGTHEHGDRPQRMRLFSQCVGDLDTSECVMCWSRASAILSECLPATGGRLYLDGCFIRADNYDFFQEVHNSGTDKKLCMGDKAPTAEYGGLVEQVTRYIVDQAPSLDGFSVSDMGNDKIAAYGLGMCWKTLDEDLCKICLADGLLEVTKCLPSKGGAVLNSGCYLRYSDHPFYHDRTIASTLGIAGEFILRFLIAAVVSGLALTFGLCIGKFIYLHKSGRNKQKEKESPPTYEYDSSNYMRFKYSTLGKATDNFNETCKLGAGAYGEVFKGTLPDGREIAIKRLHVSGKKPPEEIHNEIAVINRCQHRNLVRLLGCCFTNMNSFLVYEFLANTSLDQILFHPEKKKELDWMKRLEIILGTAEGLEYLHKACQVIHRDIKASNILLDLKYRPKISDFGLAKFYPSGNKNTRTFSIAGTLGYMAPEVISKGTLTYKIDVYSFGVLVLEITSGVRNNKVLSDNSLETLVTRTWKSFTSNNVEETIDKDMENVNVNEVKRVIQIGLLCTQFSPDLRPPMIEVIKILRHSDIQLPSPTKPPFIDEFV